jgi:hypothetical protein
LLKDNRAVKIDNLCRLGKIGVPYLMKNLEFIGEGRNRKVYRHKNYVIKIPINEYGDLDNLRESLEYKRNREKNGKSWDILGRCKLLKNGYLLMEYIELVDNPYSKDMPEWVSFIDCGQVGYDKRGRLKAYDYGG